MSMSAPAAIPRPGFLARRQRSYILFIVTALVVVGAVIVFPWLFTVWMSVFDWKIGSVAHFIGFDNYIKLAANQRFHESIVHTLYFTALAVVVPLILGTIAAPSFTASFDARGAALYFTRCR
jgi:multiple sugar transport system permease protein